MVLSWPAGWSRALDLISLVGGHRLRLDLQGPGFRVVFLFLIFFETDRQKRINNG